MFLFSCNANMQCKRPMRFYLAKHLCEILIWSTRPNSPPKQICICMPRPTLLYPNHVAFAFETTACNNIACQNVQYMDNGPSKKDKGPSIIYSSASALQMLRAYLLIWTFLSSSMLMGEEQHCENKVQRDCTSSMIVASRLPWWHEHWV